MANDTYYQSQAAEATACYSLPYGGIGFASHIVTYYTMAILAVGRRQLRPWKAVKHKVRSMILSGIQLIVTTVLSALAINKCREEWEFVILGVWMLTTSICVSALTIVSPMLNKDFEGKYCYNSGDLVLRRLNILLKVCIPWFCGSVAGAIALVKLSIPYLVSGSQLYIVNNVFATSLALTFIGAIIFCFKSRLAVSAIFWIVPLSFLALLWMDWSLGVVTGTLAGVPSSQAASIYWTYIVAKRLGLLST